MNMVVFKLSTVSFSTEINDDGKNIFEVLCF